MSTKRRELSDPQSCLNRAGELELIFVLLARDAAAPAAIRKWVDERMLANKINHEQAKEALLCADMMEDQRKGFLLHKPAPDTELNVRLRTESLRMWDLIRSFVEHETSQTSYAELKGSQSMDIPVEFLALCEFAEEMGVKLP